MSYKTKKTILPLICPIATIAAITPIAVSLSSCGQTAKITDIVINTTQNYVKTNATVNLQATVSGTGNFDKTVIWTIEEGSEYASLNGNVLTAGSETGKAIKVKATAKGDTTKSKTLTITTSSEAPIVFNMVNCTYTTTKEFIGASDSVTVVITRDDGCNWPQSINISGCYSSQTRADPKITITLTNPQANLITVTCICTK